MKCVLSILAYIVGYAIGSFGVTYAFLWWQDRKDMKKYEK